MMGTRVSSGKAAIMIKTDLLTGHQGLFDQGRLRLYPINIYYTEIWKSFFNTIEYKLQKKWN